MKKILSLVLTGLFIVLGIASIFGNSEEVKVKITEIRYYGNSSKFSVDFDLEDADADQHAQAENHSSFYADRADITVYWIQNPNNGAPPPESGFDTQDPENPNRSGGAYVDSKKNKWKIAREQHGGPHWDVSLKAGKHINVMPPTPDFPYWKVRGNKLPKGLPCRSKTQAKRIIGNMNSGGIDIDYPRQQNVLVGIMERVGEGYLIHNDSTTFIAVTISPTSEGASDGGLLKITLGN